jgi:cyclopropane-fatty-acyl-phospholipid synthase
VDLPRGIRHDATGNEAAAERASLPDEAAAPARRADPAAPLVLSLFQRLFHAYHPRDFMLRLWDGTTWPAETAVPRFVWTIRRPDAPRRMFRAWDTDASLGEAYVYGDFDLDGDLEAALDVGDWLLRGGLAVRDRLRIVRDLRRLPAGRRDGSGRGPHAARLRGRLHSRRRDREGIAFHYDRSNDFFALWLDERLVYSCAYFERGDEALDVAQEKKLDYVCRKLRLRPGERLLDIGCGWGALVMHAAARYGARTLGITLSGAQAELASRRIERSGLAARCRVEVRDYRDAEPAGGYDKLASIGMVEHVGEAMLPEYFAKAFELLRPGGVFLNHGIVRNASERRLGKETFDAKFVFPDGKLTTLHQVVRSAEEAGFEVRDVESLREHYARTLRHWARRLEDRRAEARRHVDEPTYRIFRLYLAGAAHAFAVGRLNVHQVLLVRPDAGRSGLPPTRADWYAPASGA